MVLMVLDRVALVFWGKINKKEKEGWLFVEKNNESHKCSLGFKVVRMRIECLCFSPSSYLVQIVSTKPIHFALPMEFREKGTEVKIKHANKHYKDI